jgi:hypothetical protein
MDGTPIMAIGYTRRTSGREGQPFIGPLRFVGHEWQTFYSGVWWDFCPADEMVITHWIEMPKEVKP